LGEQERLVVVLCFHCGKPRCFFSQEKNRKYFWAAALLKTELEATSFCYSCGDLIFDDDHPAGKILNQQQNLTCESRVEMAYYNTSGRDFDTEDVCIHCGASGSIGYIFGQKELHARNKTGGLPCYLICSDCLHNGKTPVNYSKKKIDQTLKRKEELNEKASKAAKRKKA
jgi:hypothetical protein